MLGHLRSRHPCICILQSGCPKPPNFSTQFEWWKASNRLCEMSTCQLLCIAWVEHVTSAGMSSILWFLNCAPLFCPLPLLPHWLWERTICMQLVWREAVGAISVCHLILLAFYSVYSHSHMLSHPSSLPELFLGFCPYCEHTERFTVFVRGHISVVLGWEAWWISQDLLRRMGNDFLLKFLICMLIAVLLKIILF